MHPILFDFGAFTIYSYGVLLAAAYLLGLQFALVRARAKGDLGTRPKGDSGDVVTDLDLAAEELVIARLTAAFPSRSITVSQNAPYTRSYSNGSTAPTIWTPGLVRARRKTPLPMSVSIAWRRSRSATCVRDKASRLENTVASRATVGCPRNHLA